MYKITCFLKEEQEDLLAILRPLQFTVDRNKKLIWDNGLTHFIIEPFSSRGRETQGYRIYFNGTPESYQYLFDRFLGYFSPSISGIEFKMSTGEKQEFLISKSEKAGFTRGGMYGIYTFKGVGIVIFPNGEINLQIRNRKFQMSQIAIFAKEIENVVKVFQPQNFNLFSFEQISEQEGFAS